MATQDCFSFVPETANKAGIHIVPRSTTASSSSNSLRKLLGPCATLSSTPASCRTVNFSSWSQFTATPVTTPSGSLKASDLCKNSGLAATYDPPTSEWAYLGADKNVCRGNADEVRMIDLRRKHQRRQTTTSCSKPIATSGAGEEITPMLFTKREVKRTSSSSTLTKSLQQTPGSKTQPYKRMTLSEKMGLKEMRYDELPSVFESDSDDEEDWERE